MKGHEVPNVSGYRIHLMLGKTLEKGCMGGCGMLCVMHVLDEFEPKEATNLVSPLLFCQTNVGQIPRCRNPTLAKCEDETRTPKVGDLESSGTLECLEFDSKGQNTSP